MFVFGRIVAPVISFCSWRATFVKQKISPTPDYCPLMLIYLHLLCGLHFASSVLVMNFETWLTDLIGDDTRRTASTKAGMAESTLSRQLSRGKLSPEMVIALCRAYNRSPVTGLIETGYIYPHEIEGPGVAAALDRATNQELLDAVMRRSDPEARYLFGGDDDTIGLAEDATVFDLPPANVTPVPYDAVADSSPDEDALRESEEGDAD